MPAASFHILSFQASYMPFITSILRNCAFSANASSPDDSPNWRFTACLYATGLALEADLPKKCLFHTLSSSFFRASSVGNGHKSAAGINSFMLSYVGKVAVPISDRIPYARSDPYGYGGSFRARLLPEVSNWCRGGWLPHQPLPERPSWLDDDLYIRSLWSSKARMARSRRSNAGVGRVS